MKLLKSPRSGAFACSLAGDGRLPSTCCGIVEIQHHHGSPCLGKGRRGDYTRRTSPPLHVVHRPPGSARRAYARLVVVWRIGSTHRASLPQARGAARRRTSAGMGGWTPAGEERRVDSPGEESAWNPPGGQRRTESTASAAPSLPTPRLPPLWIRASSPSDRWMGKSDGREKTKMSKAHGP